MILFPLLFALATILSIPFMSTSPSFAVVGCHLTKIGPNAPKDVVYPPGCQDGALPSKDRAALLAQIKTFAGQGKIVFAQPNDKTGMTNGTGVVRRSDGENVTIDTQILRAQVYLVNKGFTFSISSMIGGHSKTSSSGNISKHWVGGAFDVNVINGKDIDTGGASAKPATISFMKALNELTGGDLEVRQMICSGNGRVDPDVLKLQKNVSGVIDGHTNHVHVGY